MSEADEHGEMTPDPMLSVPGQAEEAARSPGRRERYLQKLIEGGSDVFLVLDREGTISFRSSGGKRLTGWDDDEVVAQPMTSFLAPDSLAAAQEALGEMLSKPDQPVRTELHVRHKDGSYLDMEVRGRNLLDDPDVEGVVIAAHDITERKRAEEALRESQQVLESTLNALPTSVFWKDWNLVFLGCNAAFARDAGFSEPAEIIGKDDHQMGWREQADDYRDDDLQVLESGCAKTLIEEVQTTPSGDVITLLTSKVPLRDANGEVCGLLGTYFDITDRKRMEAALRDSEVRYRRLFEAAQDGVLLLDPATAEIFDVNPFLCDLLGTSREQIVGKKIWELGPFRDVPAAKVNFRQLQQSQYIRYEDLPLETVDGREIAVEFVSNVYQVAGEDVIQCNIRDITERKRSSEENARLIQTIEQTSESIVMTDTDGTIVYVNPAFEDVSGWTREEAVGKNPRILKSGRQDDAFYRVMWETLARGEVWTGRLVNRRKDGTIFEESATISPIRDAAGQIINYVAAKRDVSAEIALQERLHQAQRMEAVGRLAAGVAHDFNNLLGIILGYAELVRNGLSADDPLREDMAHVLEAAERAVASTRQLLALGRKQPRHVRSLDLSSVVSASAKILSRLVGENTELEIRLQPALGSIRADAGQIEQVLLNLVLNARDALPEGGRITIETRNEELAADGPSTHGQVPPGSYVLLTVTDTGSGMDAATQAKIFEPFFTTKETGKGTGLGLAVVYGIVHQSGGELEVESEVGVGTTFKVYLPRFDDPVLAPADTTVQGALARGTETVLLVDDEAALLELSRRVLESHGYSVLAARDGEEAVRLSEVHAGPIEILVTDVIMPGATGTQVAEIIAADRPEMKVLYVSGYSEESIVRRDLLGSGRAFLSKPFGLALLLRRVRELLDEG